MATRKNATKTSSRATLNLPIWGNKKQNKKKEKQVEKTIKTSGPKTLFVAFLCLIIGAVIGIAAFFVVCRNDTFEINGPEEITLTLNEKYIETGAKAVEFGKDISSDVMINSNLNLDSRGFSNEVGTFYVEYTIDSLKYGKIFKIKKIKLVTFVENGEAMEPEVE